MQNGVAHFAMCQAIERLGLNSTCVGIGTQVDKTGKGVRIAEVLLKYNKKQYQEFSQLMCAPVELASEEFRENEVDLLIVDQKLSSSLVDTLVTHWLPRLSDRGVIFLLGDNENTLIDDLSKDQRTLRFESGGGAAIIAAGLNLGEPLDHLLNATNHLPTLRSIDRALSQLGTHNTYELLLVQETKRVKEAEQNLSLIAKQLAEVQRDHKVMQEKFNQLNEAYDRRHMQVAKLQAEAFDSCNIKKENTEIRDLLSARQEDFAVLSDTKKGVDEAMENPADALEEILTNQDKRISDLVTQNEALQAERSQLTEDLATRFKELALLTDRLEQTTIEREQLRLDLELERSTRAAIEAEAASFNEKTIVRITKRDRRISELAAEKEALQTERDQLTEDLATRFDELALLTDRLEQTTTSGAAAKVDSISLIPPKKNSDVCDYLFVIKGEMSSRHLVQAHRFITGLPVFGLSPAVFFTNPDWAKKTWAGQHLIKLNYVTICDDLTNPPASKCVILEGNENELHYSAMIADELHKIYKNNLVLSNSFGAEPTAHAPFLLNPSMAIDLEKLQHTDKEKIVILSKQPDSWLSPLEGTPFFYAVKAAAKNAENKLLVSGSGWSDDNVYEAAMIANLLGRTPYKYKDMLDIEPQHNFDFDDLNKRLISNISQSGNFEVKLHYEGLELILKRLAAHFISDRESHLNLVCGVQSSGYSSRRSLTSGRPRFWEKLSLLGPVHKAG
ncbi:hypothetical protein GCM10007094_33700 [Pseudovibrio japonicus]|uniref:Uncharacterized protein n=2 Tax=Pseudovibrio japonicus TaxID=366534 RepID=A0ABQ3EJ08_9HYPH|nr:hypothetical protein GCM10007094_33700 [Pseudovibrio japonicus]